MNQDQHNGKDPLPIAERIAYLIAGFLQKTLSESEKDELDAWIITSDENLKLFEELTDKENIDAELRRRQLLDPRKTLLKIKQDTGLRNEKSFFQFFWPYAITASLVLGIIGWFVFHEKTQPTSSITKVQKNTNIHPGSDRAVLTLANGRTLILDSSGSGFLASEGNIRIEKNGSGEIEYLGNEPQMQMNLVSTPRGGQYRIVLGDGTRVWLNAETSLQFPAGFSGSTREVELKGEAYFEVAKNPFRLFRVKILSPSGEAGTVEVLGTHFNVNAYSDDGFIKTTLLEGSVKVEKNGQTALLIPGDQALMKTDIKLEKVDVQKEIAWKAGVFVFHEASIQIIAAQLSRWYDIETELNGNFSHHFNATIDRKESLSNVLNLLEATQRVHFKLEGRKLIITP